MAVVSGTLPDPKKKKKLLQEIQCKGAATFVFR